MPRELTPAELAAMLRTTEHAAAKPAPPVSMRAAAARGLVAGLGVIMTLGGGLFWAQAPLDTLTTAPLVAGVFVAGVVLVVSAIPSEKIAPALLTARRIQQVQATVNAAEFRKRAAYSAVVGLETRIAELERALTQMTHERDLAIYDLTHEREQAAQRNSGRSAYVPGIALAPQEIRDATAMMRLRYDTGAHPSKEKCKETFKWTDDRWKAAQAELVRARIIQVNTTQNKWLPATLDDALRAFGEYMLHARELSAPTINRTLGVALYVESQIG